MSYPYNARYYEKKREKRIEARKDGRSWEPGSQTSYVQLIYGLGGVVNVLNTVKGGLHCFAGAHSVVPMLARFSGPSRSDRVGKWPDDKAVSCKGLTYFCIHIRRKRTGQPVTKGTLTDGSSDILVLLISSNTIFACDFSDARD